MSTPLESNKLFVWNLHREVRRQDLKEYFSERGEVTYTSVALDRESRRSRWFGFVTFEKTEDAAKAKEAANEKEFKWRTIYIDFARIREESTEQQYQEEKQTEEL